MRKLGSVLQGFGLLLLMAALILAVWNIRADNQAGENAQQILEELVMPVMQDDASQEETMPEVRIPDHILDPDMDMPVKTVDGQDYVGVIILHELGLELPVMGDWDYTRLKKAPCLYSGSAYQDDLVIMAHNYRSQFGRIRRLKAGNRITFTDMDGNAFHYLVNAVEVLSPYEVEKVTNGEWDLTLFTCTLGGQNRIVVRCDRE
ncbi:MAG: sortase [Oscillospiraceae bacterium]|nr:sortase [Oscillospiraceae bacterium]